MKDDIYILVTREKETLIGISTLEIICMESRDVTFSKLD